MSPILTITALESGFGSLVTGTVLYLVLSRGRKPYHYLFAAFLFICFVWDFGTFVLMIRNSHLEELPVIGRIAILPCTFIPVLIFHFVNLYTSKPVRWAVIALWVLTGLMWIPILAGWVYRIEGNYSYVFG